MHDIPSAVSQMIEESTMIKALLGFKEEGLEVIINGIRKSLSITSGPTF